MQEIEFNAFFPSSLSCLRTCLWCYNRSDLNFKAYIQNTHSTYTRTHAHTYNSDRALEFTRRRYQLNESLTYLFDLFQIKFTVRQHF